MQNNTTKKPMKAKLTFNLPEDEHEFYCATSKTKRKEYKTFYYEMENN